MTTMTFDSIAYVRMLEEGGFTRQQAETQTEVLRRQAEVQARPSSPSCWRALAAWRPSWPGALAG